MFPTSFFNTYTPIQQIYTHTDTLCVCVCACVLTQRHYLTATSLAENVYFQGCLHLKRCIFSRPTNVTQYWQMCHSVTVCQALKKEQSTPRSLVIYRRSASVVERCLTLRLNAAMTNDYFHIISRQNVRKL